MNKLAGRRVGDPTASAILPWVTDFSVEDGGFRDLTRTKFRLTKGESQLDATFQRDANQPPTAPLLTIPAPVDLLSTGAWQKAEGSEVGVAYLPTVGGANERNHDHFVPHHLLDIMPNLAYFTYKVRSAHASKRISFLSSIYECSD